MKVFILSFFYLSIMFFPGCSKDENPIDPNTGNYKVDGSWTGKTSQGENISFRIEGDWMRQLNIKINVSGGAYTQNTSSMICLVEKNSFSYATTTTMGRLEFSGTFKSSTSSEGTFSLNSTGGTWSAAK
ncbi:MAG: hypothetical protein EHM64_08810 [Ignavibacteriae bacterium]|nr:MAG: hypothetical protein EHM64_08810 [Ignavibacteriota bacterium]